MTLATIDTHTALRPAGGARLPALASSPADDPVAALARNALGLRKIAIVGSVVIAVFIVGFGAWAAVAPLASAALAVGVVSPEGYRQTIQHLEGGIILELPVRDGDRVGAGDTLLVLDATRDTAAFDMVRMQHRAAAASLARLAAESSGADAITFPEWLTKEAAANPAVASLLQAQLDQFDSQRIAAQGQKDILNRRIAQLHEEITGLRAKIDSSTTQLALIEEEIEGVETLVERGLERRPRLLQLQRGKAQIEGARASDTAQVARAQQSIGEAEAQILAVDSKLQDEIATERGQVQTEYAALEERLRATGDVVGRTRIAAPVDGTVVGLKFHTIGGVVAPGAPILDIVPSDSPLIIDARVSPQDIDTVQVGQPAMVRFSAYHQRDLPRIDGTVTYVAADSTLDEKSGQAYFVAKIAVDPELIREVAPRVQLSAGMPAEVSITTGERTALEYMFDPLVHSFYRSFTED